MKKRPTRIPSPKIDDPRQLDLIEALNETLEIKFLEGLAEKRKSQGFAKLDAAIVAELKKAGR